MTAAWTEAWEGEFDTLDALPRRAAETVGLKEWARPGSRFVFRARFVNEEGLSLSSLRRVVHIKQTTENGPARHRADVQAGGAGHHRAPDGRDRRGHRGNIRDDGDLALRAPLSCDGQFTR